MRGIKLHLSMVAAAATLLLAYSVPAGAGADVYHDNFKDGDCYDVVGMDQTFCWSQKGIWHQTQTPSGNFIYRFTGSYEQKWFVTSTGELLASWEQDYKDSALIKKGMTHRASFVFNDSYCYGGMSMTFTVDYKFVNGKVIRYNTEYTTGEC